MSEWFKCDYCHGPADIEGTCPRCAELKRLEREIGRAVIRDHLVDNIRDHFGGALWEGKDNSALRADALMHNLIEREIGRHEVAHLIARWRELHAEGAEAEAATERQEGER